MLIQQQALAFKQFHQARGQKALREKEGAIFTAPSKAVDHLAQRFKRANAGDSMNTAYRGDGNGYGGGGVEGGGGRGGKNDVVDDEDDASRMRYILDMVYDLKNNKKRLVESADQFGNLKKWIKNIERMQNNGTKVGSLSVRSLVYVFFSKGVCQCSLLF